MQDLQEKTAAASEVRAESIVFSRARVKMRSGEVHEWRHCRYRLEPTPCGIVLSIITMGPRWVEGTANDSDAFFFCTMDVVESVEMIPLKPQDAIS